MNARSSPASTTWPGQLTIQASLGVRVWASKLDLSTDLTVSRMAASHSISQRSTAPPADLGLNGLAAAGSRGQCFSTLLWPFAEASSQLGALLKQQRHLDHAIGLYSMQ